MGEQEYGIGFTLEGCAQNVRNTLYGQQNHTVVMQVVTPMVRESQHTQWMLGRPAMNRIL